MEKGFDSNIKFWKPNLFQKIIYALKLKKDPRYNGKKHNWMEIDELAHMPNPNVEERWNVIKDGLNSDG